jgi:hypothetical protein
MQPDSLLRITAFRCMVLLICSTVVTIVESTLVALTVDISVQPARIRVVLDDDGNQWYLKQWNGFGSVRLVAWRSHECTEAHSLRAPSWTHVRKGRGEPDGLWEDARGWPFLCFCARFREFDALHSVAYMRPGIDLRGGLECDPFPSWFRRGRPSAASARIIPYEPIWSGLFGNLVLWSLGLYVAYVACRRMYRGWITFGRKRTGLCAKCGYCLTRNISGVCPECGQPICNAG